MRDKKPTEIINLLFYTYLINISETFRCFEISRRSEFARRPTNTQNKLSNVTFSPIVYYLTITVNSV